MKSKHLIGISTYAYPFACGNDPDFCPEQPFTHFTFLDRAHELGLKCVQLANNLPLDVLDADDLASLRSLADEYGILIETGMLGLEPEKIRQNIDIATALGSPILRCVPGVLEEDPVTIDDVYEVLKDFLPLLKERNIIFAVENHDKFTAPEHERLMERLGDEHFGLVLDTTNSLSIEEPVEKLLEHMAKYCVCLHFKDYQIHRFNRGRGLQITGQCIGKGRLDIPRFFDGLLSRAERDFNIILESWMTPCGTLEQTLAQEDEWVRIGIDYLRKMF